VPSVGNRRTLDQTLVGRGGTRRNGR
jgi:hypothetical protein